MGKEISGTNMMGFLIIWETRELLREAVESRFRRCDCVHVPSAPVYQYVFSPSWILLSFIIGCPSRPTTTLPIPPMVIVQNDLHVLRFASALICRGTGSAPLHVHSQPMTDICLSTPY